MMKIDESKMINFPKYNYLFFEWNWMFSRSMDDRISNRLCLVTSTSGFRD